MRPGAAQMLVATAGARASAVRKVRGNALLGRRDLSRGVHFAGIGRALHLSPAQTHVPKFPAK